MTPDQACPMCLHPQRLLIEQALFLDVKSPRRVAVDFGLALGAVLDHQRAHVVWPRRPVPVCLPGLCEPYGYTPPDGAATTRPVPPSWASVAPLLERWQMALVPHPDRSWDVLAFWNPLAPPQDARRVAFAALPQAIADVAARCEATAALAAGEGEG